MAAVIPLVTGAPVAVAATGTVSGTVFNDVDQNGSRSGSEVGVPNVWVRVVGQAMGPDSVLGTSDDTETSYAPVRTTASGTWSIASVTSDSDVRVEYLGVDVDGDGVMQASEETLPAWFRPGPVGPDNGSSVQFVALGGSTSYAVANPADYCQANPDLVTSCMTLGSNTTYPQAIARFSSSLDGAITGEATAAQVGATHGIAYRRDGNIFAATMTKRHTEYGSAGATNTIYRMQAGGSDTPTTLVTLPGTLTAHNASNYLVDAPTWSVIGKEGLGGIRLSEDESSLYAVNLNDRRLYSVPLNGVGAAVTAGTPTSVAIPAPAGCVTPPAVRGRGPGRSGLRGWGVLRPGVRQRRRPPRLRHGVQPVGDSPLRSRPDGAGERLRHDSSGVVPVRLPPDRPELLLRLV